jgi:hypothetical protein
VIQKMAKKQPGGGLLTAAHRAKAAKVSFRSVFEVDGGRLAIGHFSRPLVDEERRSLNSAWERSKLPGVEDFEVTAKQVSFVTPPKEVEATWASIDRILANPSMHSTS